jgi:hypothetical protein
MSQDSSFETLLQESLVKPLQRFASRLRQVLFDPVGGALLPALQQNYAAEQRLAQQLRVHAALMPNALFRDTYTQMIAAMEQHARLLAAQIHRLGSSVPADDGQTLAPTATATLWRLMAADIAAIGALSAQYQAQLGWVADPQVRQLLHQIREQQQQQRRVLSDLLARVDSYARPEINHHVSA